MPFTTTLKNAISRNRIAHAYIFTGPRGIGKTTIARVFAKALNCEKGPTPVPCDKCTSCTEKSEKSLRESHLQYIPRKMRDAASDYERRDGRELPAVFVVQGQEGQKVAHPFEPTSSQALGGLGATTLEAGELLFGRELSAGWGLDLQLLRR